MVARELVGKQLVRRTKNGIIREKITEVEAYIGPHDLACHSSRGKTPRNAPMFEKAGTIYVYFVYGVHWMFNIVTERKGYPAAILIRGTENFKGPGLVTKNLTIDKRLNGKMIGYKTGLWIEESKSKIKTVVERSTRVGVTYAGKKWAGKPYRFILTTEENPMG